MQQKQQKMRDELKRLGWTQHRLLIEANNVAHRMLLDEARGYTDVPSEIQQYVRERERPGTRERGTYNTRVLSRATLHNIIHGKHMVTPDKAILVLTAINNGRKRAGYKTELDYEDIGIDLYLR